LVASGFSDGVKLGDDAKVMIEQTAGKWIVEVPEPFWNDES
jgi:hypothetical protein